MTDETTPVLWEQAGPSEVAYLPRFDLVLRPTSQGWKWLVCEGEEGTILAEGQSSDYEVAKQVVVKTAELLSR